LGSQLASCTALASAVVVSDVGVSAAPAAAGPVLEAVDVSDAAPSEVACGVPCAATGVSATAAVRVAVAALVGRDVDVGGPTVSVGWEADVAVGAMGWAAVGAPPHAATHTTTSDTPTPSARLTLRREYVPHAKCRQLFVDQACMSS
jgi:hypothetical protein